LLLLEEAVAVAVKALEVALGVTKQVR